MSRTLLQLMRSRATALVLVTVVVVTACMSDRLPTAVRQTPTSVDAARSSPDVTARNAVEDARKAEHERLMRQRDSVRAVFKQLRDASDGEYRSALAAWNAYRRDLNQRRKIDRTAGVELLRCQPQPFTGDAEVIGPGGGTLHIGPHTLVVPKDALDHEVLLTGVAPTSPLVQVQFGPHGLQFLTAAQLTLSYEQCTRPSNFTYRIVYVEEQRVLEFPPSSDDKTLKKVTAPIGHFSGYMIAY